MKDRATRRGRKRQTRSWLLLLFLLLTCFCWGCAANGEPSPDAPVAADAPAETDEAVLQVSGDGIDGVHSFTYAELAALPNASFAHVYSTVNNWPSARFYAASGIRVAAILEAAGVLESARTLTFRSADGYQAVLTRAQLLEPQYYYPQPGESSDNAEPVEPIIAFSYREGSQDMTEIAEDAPCLILGQRDPFQQSNPAFVVNVSEIIVSAAPEAQWEAPGVFPLAGQIAAGESVKLQHPSYGLVKLHYTLDGSDPTALSPVYNPSTYQPELNKPILITEDTEIRAIAIGYGREDSEIAVFYFQVTK